MDFGWMSKKAYPPMRWDLRVRGWRMHALADDLASAPADFPILLDWRDDSRPPLPRGVSLRRRCLVAGAGHGMESASLLASGFGDAIPPEAELGELAQRLSRVAGHASAMPRQCWAGPLLLDLFQRDARMGDRWLALHPREFAVLWRLAEAGGATIPRADLLADIWRLAHDPGTNRVEVHISRLRGKLADVGCAGLVATDPAGGYRLSPERQHSMALSAGQESKGNGTA